VVLERPGDGFWLKARSVAPTREAIEFAKLMNFDCSRCGSRQQLKPLMKWSMSELMAAGEFAGWLPRSLRGSRWDSDRFLRRVRMRELS